MPMHDDICMAVRIPQQAWPERTQGFQHKHVASGFAKSSSSPATLPSSSARLFSTRSSIPCSTITFCISLSSSGSLPGITPSFLASVYVR